MRPLFAGRPPGWPVSWKSIWWPPPSCEPTSSIESTVAVASRPEALIFWILSRSFICPPGLTACWAVPFSLSMNPIVLLLAPGCGLRSGFFDLLVDFFHHFVGPFLALLDALL